MIMIHNYFQHPYRYISDQEGQSSEENGIDDEYLFLDISTTLSTIKNVKTNTEVFIDIQQKSQKVLDWISVISIISAIIICLIAFIILCKRQIHHRRYLYSQIKSRQSKRNQNNNQTSLMTVDAAECIDGDIEFVEGLNILLAKGNLILNNDDAQMLNSMNTFNRLQCFQELANDVR